jgi:hypothetical protein
MRSFWTQPGHQAMPPHPRGILRPNSSSTLGATSISDTHNRPVVRGDARPATDQWNAQQFLKQTVSMTDAPDLARVATQKSLHLA